MFEKFITKGHFQNIPYATSLNAELRNPQIANIIRINSLTEKITTFMPRQKVHLKGNANDIKNRLNAEFECLYPTLFPKTGYRGIQGLTKEQYQKVLALKKGDVVQDAGFAYFSKYKNVATDFSNGLNPILVKCKIPFWSKISRMLTFIPQYQNGVIVFKKGEFLFPAGSRFEVLKNKTDKNGIVKLVLKYLK